MKIRAKLNLDADRTIRAHQNIRMELNHLVCEMSSAGPCLSTCELNVPQAVVHTARDRVDGTGAGAGA